ERALGVGCCERLVRVLAVQRHEALAQLGKLRERCGPTVDPCAAAATGVQYAAHDERLLAGEVLLCEPCVNRGCVVDLELGGQLRAVRAGPQLAQLEAIAEQEAQRIEQD